MSNKSINLVATVVMPLVVIAATVGLFFLFQPDAPTSLFYANLSYTVFLEAVFFGYLNITRVKTTELSTPFFVIFGVYCGYYIFFGVAWMLGYWYFLAHSFETLRLYVAVIIVLTLLWLIVSTLTAQTDSNYKQTVGDLKTRGATLNAHVQKITTLAARYEQACAAKGLKYETESSNRSELDRLKGKIHSLTPNVLNNGATAAEITALSGKCEDLIAEMESASNESAAAVQKKMQQFVNSAIADLDMMKNLARK